MIRTEQPQSHSNKNRKGDRETGDRGKGAKTKTQNLITTAHREREREGGRRKGRKSPQHRQNSPICRRGRRNGKPKKKTATKGPNRVGQSTDMGET